MRPVVRNIKNDMLYFYCGNDEYENIVTGKKGIVEPEVARKNFKLNIEATQMIFDNPNIADLIRSINLKMDSSELLNMPL